MTRILETDFIASMSLIGPLFCDIFAVLFIVALVSQPMPLDVRRGAMTFIIACVAPITVLGIGLLAWRLWSFFSIFAHGSEVTATIDLLSFGRAGRANYTYIYHNLNYTSGAGINKTERTKALSIGDQVTVIVDPNKPERAFIRELYLD